MLAGKYLKPKVVEVVEVPLPDVGDHEALIKIEACGFCGSDLGIVAGVHPRARAPLTLGHEFSGRIVEIRSSGSTLKAGDLVTAYPLISCGHCYVCRHGEPHVCRDLRLFGIDVDGGMAEYVKLPVSSLVLLPAQMPARIGALIEPLAVAVHGVSMSPIQQPQTAVVIGAGPIGLLTALVAKARGIPRVLISDIVPSRVDLARRLGLRAVMAGEALTKILMEETGGEGADVVFECAGAPSTAREMTALVRCRGVIVNLGVFKKPAEVDLQIVNFREITIVGSRVYSRHDFEEAVQLASVLPLERIVTHSFSLRQVEAAFELFRSGQNACKVLILPDGAPA
ncbi:MAG TPA: alcohol dehydrogenase catalytic domain-containing protein [Acidobacteriaceae bacterium]|nr:alcohol dehydrogenase catalytic domain-containing protein [Acidobacteriaceae bacterium]